MASSFGTKPPAWFWLIAILLLLWEVMGVWSWYEHVANGPRAMGQVPTDYDIAYFAKLPGWYAWLYASAVFTGLAAGLLLLARKAAARGLALVSLVLTILMFAYTFLATDLIAAKGVWTTYFPAFIIAMGVVVWWFAGLGVRRGWLR